MIREIFEIEFLFCLVDFFVQTADAFVDLFNRLSQLFAEIGAVVGRFDVFLNVIKFISQLVKTGFFFDLLKHGLGFFNKATECTGDFGQVLRADYNECNQQDEDQFRSANTRHSSSPPQTMFAVYHNSQIK